MISARQDVIFPNQLVLDPKKYRGKGRPRRDDYSDFYTVYAEHWLDLMKSYTSYYAIGSPDKPKEDDAAQSPRNR